MTLLSFANHSIQTYGTFGMWGALLSGGYSVLPESHKDIREDREMREADIPGWIWL